MELHGKNIFGTEIAEGGANAFRAFDPRSGKKLDPPFAEATEKMVDQALRRAEEAFQDYSCRPGEEKAEFLDSIAGEILRLDDALIQRASAETGLPEERLRGERARTVAQIQMFASLIREGSWVEASIDRALPDRKPIPKPDIRRMLRPIGPVAVFGAGNFPLAFSVAGGDTASALAAGNPVVFKAHPGHPGTSEMVARAIGRAIVKNGMRDGLFSLLQGTSHQLGQWLVAHPLTRAVGFTGSFKGGRSLFDAASRRPEPIPVYAEMGSINPVFVLPGALRERSEAIAEGLKQSVTLGVGQFCTCPGLVVGLRDAAMDRMIERVADLMRRTPPATMLHPIILEGYQDGIRKVRNTAGVEAHLSENDPDESRTEACAALFVTDAQTFLKNAALHSEVFGPSTIVVRCVEKGELEKIAGTLEGHLTAAIHGTSDDLAENAKLVALLERKVGRLIFNGFPTGVEVCPSMHHGGPYPATTDAKYTSVGTAAIKRFVRPICYQSFPQEFLPAELQNDNPKKIWRLIDGEWTKSNC